MEAHEIIKVVNMLLSKDIEMHNLGLTIAANEYKVDISKMDTHSMRSYVTPMLMEKLYNDIQKLIGEQLYKSMIIKDMTTIQNIKYQLVKNQDFYMAGIYRDMERALRHLI